MTNRLAIRTLEMAPFYVMELLRRAKQMEALGRDVIHMEIGEPDFPTPSTIIDAGVKHLHTGQIKYTPAAGLPALRKKIAEHYRHYYRVDIAEERIFVTPGSSGALLLAIGISLNPGEEILLADPCYPCNSNFVRLLNGRVKLVPVNASTGYHLTEDMIRQHWSPITKGMMLASPANPTGTVIETEDLQRAIHAVDSLNGCFYSDEIYHGLVYGDKVSTALQFSNEVFVINSFSKYYGMTGWRVGWLIVPEAFIDAAERLAQNIFIASPTLSQYAAMAAFDEQTLVELEFRRETFSQRRDFLYDNLLRLGFAIPIKPQGAFYIYADCSSLCDDSFQFALDFLQAEAVAVTPGKDFGRHQCHRYIRFAYTTDLDRMAVAMQRLEKFIRQR